MVFNTVDLAIARGQVTLKSAAAAATELLQKGHQDFASGHGIAGVGAEQGLSPVKGITGPKVQAWHGMLVELLPDSQHLRL